MYDDTKEHEDLERREQERAEAKRKQAREHPVRAKILELFGRDEGRSLKATAVLQDLSGVDTSLSCVAYHINVLKEVGLLPKDARAATA